MNENTKETLSTILIVVWKSIVGLFVLFATVVVLRMLYVFTNTPNLVAKIHSTKLTMDDVLGVNLPPDPGIEAAKTIAGIDVNNNGIRDDVELAIFKEYPDSAKTRAVLLQYALALQMEAIQPFENRDNVTAVAIEGSRADTCLSDTLVPRKSPESSRSNIDIEKIDKYIDFVKNWQLNTKERLNSQHDFYQNNLGSYAESTDPICDIDISLLSN